MRGDSPILSLDAFEENLRRRKQGRWIRILATESPGRRAGRRPRDPEKEALLIRLDEARLEGLRRSGDPWAPGSGAGGGAEGGREDGAHALSRHQRP